MAENYKPNASRYHRTSGSPPPKPFERVMVFVDGGYLRELCKKYYNRDDLDFGKLTWTFIRMFNTFTTNPFQADLIRIYWYDAIVDEGDPDFEDQKQYFQTIEDRGYYTVRLGKLVRSSTKGFKQKGVDILMSIDALSKAYQDHYDTGMFMMGDRDFVPLIEAVKDAGKKTMIVCHPPSTTYDLMRVFDRRIYFKKDAIGKWLK